jgi:hypothetical protein
MKTVNKTVVQPVNQSPLGGPGYINIPKAMAEASAPHRPDTTPVPKGSQKIPPEGMVVRKRVPLTSQVVFEHGIPIKTRTKLL